MRHRNSGIDRYYVEFLLEGALDLITSVHRMNEHAKSMLYDAVRLLKFILCKRYRYLIAKLPTSCRRNPIPLSYAENCITPLQTLVTRYLA